ncbi:MAG: peptidylprolyl isomerase [Roseovarius sp.]
MSFSTKPLLAAATAVLLAAGPLAHAQDAPDPAQVLATVNGTEITLGHVIAVRADLPPQYDQLPNELLFDGILEQLINQTLLKQSSDEELSLRSRIMLENEERALAAGEVIERLMEGGVDEADLRAAYDEQYPEVADELEYRASHILVETKDEAAALVEELAGGADFAALARENSTGPSASVGGDLGWFGDGDMVAAFFDAVKGLEPGEISAPVQTDFGWHVIRLAETRQKERPEFDTVRGELENQLQQDIIGAKVAELEAEAEIDTSGAEAVSPEAISNYDLLEN